MTRYVVTHQVQIGQFPIAWTLALSMDAPQPILASREALRLFCINPPNLPREGSMLVSALFVYAQARLGKNVRAASVTDHAGVEWIHSEVE